MQEGYIRLGCGPSEFARILLSIRTLMRPPRRMVKSAGALLN